MLPLQQHNECRSVSYVMYTSGTKLVEEHSFNISVYIIDSVLYCSSGTIYERSSLSSFA